MNIVTKITGVVLTGILLCGTNLNVFAAEDDRKVDDEYKTCYEIGLKMEIEEDDEVYHISSEKNKIKWDAEKVDETVYAACGAFIRQTSPNKDNKEELCIPKGTKVHRIGISENGWDIIEYEDEQYFMWYNCITDEKPVVATAPAKNVTPAAQEVQITSTDGSYLGTFQLTAYTWTGNPCADGAYPSAGYTAACNDSRLWHHWITIEGYGTYYVHDTGGMASNVIDIYMDSYDACIQFGRQSANVYYAD